MSSLKSHYSYYESIQFFCLYQRQYVSEWMNERMNKKNVSFTFTLMNAIFLSPTSFTSSHLIVKTARSWPFISIHLSYSFFTTDLSQSCYDFNHIPLHTDQIYSLKCLSLDNTPRSVMLCDTSMNKDVHKSLYCRNTRIFDAEANANVSFGRFLALSSYLAVDQSSISQPISGAVRGLKDFRCWTNNAGVKKRYSACVLNYSNAWCIIRVKVKELRKASNKEERTCTLSCWSPERLHFLLAIQRSKCNQYQMLASVWTVAFNQRPRFLCHVTIHSAGQCCVWKQTLRS